MLVRTSRILLALSFLVIGFSVKGPPADPDVLFAQTQVLGVWFLFMAWLICVVSWGRVLADKLELTGPAFGIASLALGSAWIAILSGVMGVLGLISYTSWPLVLLILLLGPVLDFVYSETPRFFITETNSRAAWERGLDWLCYGVLALAVLYYMAKAALAHGTTDPFLYHLAAARYWTDHGVITFSPRNPYFFFSGFWEHLYIFGNVLLGADKGRGLIEGQLWGQWVHIYGMITVMAVTMGLARYFGLRRPWWVLSGTLICGLYSFNNWIWLAKNDLGVMSWFLTAWFFLLAVPIPTKAQLAATGLLLGLSIIGKSTVILTAAPCFVFWMILLFRKEGIPELVRRLGFVAVGIAPVFVFHFSRNAWFTGNPFFPAATSLFPSHWIGPTLQRSVDTLWGHFTPFAPKAGQKIRELLGDTPLYWTAPIIAVALIWKRVFPENRREFLVTFAGCMTAAILFVSWDNRAYFVRWLGPTLLLLPLLILVAGVRLLDASRKYGKALSGLTALVIAVFLAATFVTKLHAALGHVLRSPSATLVIRTSNIHFGGDSRAWLRMNAQPEDLIVSTGDQLFYYISHLNVSSLDADPALDQILHSSGETNRLLRTLRLAGVRYVLDVRYWTRRFYNAKGAFFGQLVEDHPEALVYAGNDSFVVDFHRLMAEISPSCFRGDEWYAASFASTVRDKP
ncbi:MAG: hypothetical protein A2428_12990 [Bdellovibrionales bacterium RIFOXYC1_FULL_54_43]|nr:MAG: hypothetical protein A2428_12990 [Bdellovibrionales bacterium RIFOXYC1_FULL_54_43]OFZ83985.1 MAG: hypothetical protein A2603_10570 [Bdellovibrionales bacterium RIFOXYD1_FULL_55_31]